MKDLRKLSYDKLCKDILLYKQGKFIVNKKHHELIIINSLNVFNKYRLEQSYCILSFDEVFNSINYLVSYLPFVKFTK